MIKVQFGSGENKLDGWENLQEKDGDITKPLKYADNSVDYILAEHVVEHVTPQDAWRFFKEAQRILKSGGVLRVIIPDIMKLSSPTKEYKDLVRGQIEGWWKAAGIHTWHSGEVTNEDIMKTIIFCHGHKACWTKLMLGVVLASMGYSIDYPPYNMSAHKELIGVDGHWKMMGMDNCIMESSVVEATRR